MSICVYKLCPSHVKCLASQLICIFAATDDNIDVFRIASGKNN